jgi:hypothetical protein
MDIPLSDYDIKRRLPVKIYKYNELSKLKTFPDQAIVLLEFEKQGIGHWVALFHHKSIPYYFNSFGKKYDTDLNCLSRSARVILGENGNEIERLLDGSPCEYNKTKYQSDTSSVCGRYCIDRIRNNALSSSAYLKKMNKLKRQFGSYDDAIVQIVP